jgi:hypothetical protein
MMLPVLKLCLYDVELRNHPLLRGEAPDIKSSAAREISAKVRESQKREGLGFPLATLLPVSDGEPPEVGIKEVHDDIWLVSFMDYDLGYFDLDTRMLEPLDNPFGPRLSPM